MKLRIVHLKIHLNLCRIIPRIGASITAYGAAILRQFETIGTWCVNGSAGITASRDKLYAHQLMARARIGMPNTAFANSPRDTANIIALVGTAPLIVKLLESTQGKGVVLAETKKAAESVIDAFRGLKANFLVQDFVKESAGEDIRCLVIGGKVVASMKRTGAEGDFRSNLHRGGSARSVRITREERDTAIRAARAFDLNLAGVDLLRSETGPKVIEVNSSPASRESRPRPARTSPPSSTSRSRRGCAPSRSGGANRPARRPPTRPERADRDSLRASALWTQAPINLICLVGINAGYPDD